MTHLDDGAVQYNGLLNDVWYRESDSFASLLYETKVKSIPIPCVIVLYFCIPFK